jgi:Leucine-rich repeat (LRR) protein
MSNAAATGEDNNAVTGTLESVCFLRFLSILDMNYNSLSGSLANCMETLERVEILDLSFNAIDGSLPNVLCSLARLQELGLRGNRLQGGIPDCLGDLGALKSFDVSNINADGSAPGLQSLSGIIPTSLCGLAVLENLYFQFNMGLSGSIPACLGFVQPSLASLAIEGNQLTGTIPGSLCSALKLSSLFMNQNSLSGSLPECLGSLVGLSELGLDENALTGTLPEKYCALTELVYFNVLSNSLEGMFFFFLVKSAFVRFRVFF